MKGKTRIDTRPVRPAGSLAATAKATRQVMSDLDDPDLRQVLDEHDNRVRRAEFLKRKAEEQAQADVVKSRQARRRYDKALKVARKRARRKATHGRGKVRIVHSQVIQADRQKRMAQDDPSAAEELKNIASTRRPANLITKG